MLSGILTGVHAPKRAADRGADRGVDSGANGDADRDADRERHVAAGGAPSRCSTVEEEEAAAEAARLWDLPAPYAASPSVRPAPLSAVARHVCMCLPPLYAAAPSVRPALRRSCVNPVSIVVRHACPFALRALASQRETRRNCLVRNPVSMLACVPFGMHVLCTASAFKQGSHNDGAT